MSSGPGTYPEWIDAFLRLGDAARRRGRELDAAYYERAAEFFMDPSDPRKRQLRTSFVSTMRAAFGLTVNEVAFGTGALPAYELSPEGSIDGTWVMFGGFDSYIEEWFPVLVSVARGGRRVVVFDGPGQGGALEHHGLPMIANWERPLAAVLDHFGLDDVTVVGGSLGGELVMRAAAYEPRVSRVVAFDAMDDFLECVIAQVSGRAAARSLRRALGVVPASAVDAVLRVSAERSPVRQWGLWQGMHITGTDTPADFLHAIATMRTDRCSPRIAGDVLLLQGNEDHYVPNWQLRRQSSTLTQARSITCRVFTRAEQASNHCQVGNIGLAMSTILNWEDELRARNAQLFSS